MNRTDRHWIAKTAAAACLAALPLLAGACAGNRPAREPAATTEAGNLTWRVWLDPNPPDEKGNVLWVEVLDAEGRPVEGAEVDLDYLMPAMGAMAEMRGTGQVDERGEGLYRIAVDFPMRGTWGLDLTVAAERARASGEYSLTTGSRGLRQTATAGGGAPAPRGEAATAAVRIAPEHEHGGDQVAYFTCSMHPSVRSGTEGTCPICSMDLVPVTEEEVATGIIRVDSARRQTIGVTTAPAERRAVGAAIRAVGTVVYDQTRLADVSVKYRGWIGRLEVDEPGQYVRRGQTLFTVYSPELYATQQEYLTALESQRAAAQTAVPDRADYLVDAARRRLRLWDLGEAQIDRLAATGKPLEYLPIASPVSGYVIEKDVVEGASVEPGMRLFRIAGLDSVWVEAEVYESELPLIEVGQPAEVTLSYLPGRRFDGRVAFVYPYLQGATRTGTVRVRLANPDLVLKPEMYANVVIRLDLGERLVVPEQAVLYAGERSFVFVDLGDGRLKPTAVETGIQTGDEIEILSGLSAGDPVVTSGNFLIAAESRLKLAMEQWQ